MSLALFFVLLLVVARVFNWMTVEQIEQWLYSAQNLSPLYLAVIVISLLITDLVFSIPTMTVSMLAGYFLGLPLGLLCSFLGLMLAGTVGYLVSRLLGQSVLNVLLPDLEQQTQFKLTFKKHGFLMIVLSRAVPILPEICACIAGSTQMKFFRFLSAWCICSLPYAFITTYAGSVSTLKDPSPAIIVMALIWGSLWIAWYFFYARINKGNLNLP